jgi:glutamine amidotransferase
MADERQVAVVDYGMGNLFSVAQACRAVGLIPAITADPARVRDAAAVIVPGIGGFPEAMRTLERDRLIEPVLGAVRDGRPVVGICLGMQLLFEQSYEFGLHRGLGILGGTVERFPELAQGRRWKVPQVGWNRLALASRREPGSWQAAGLRDGDFMYFVHSFRVCPADPGVVAATSRYAGLEFTAAVSVGNVLGWQFHPERSGIRGVELYRALAQRVAGTIEV